MKLSGMLEPACLSADRVKTLKCLFTCKIQTDKLWRIKIFIFIADQPGGVQNVMNSIRMYQYIVLVDRCQAIIVSILP